MLNKQRIFIVEHVRIYNEENGFIIFLGKDLNTNEEMAVKGTTFNINEGDIVECIGDISFNKIYKSVQFDAKEIRLYTPKDTETILKYLETGYINGISKAIAKKIVDKFGDKTIDILDNDPDQLKQIKGIGVKTLNNIILDWNEKRIYHKQNEDLIELGFSFDEALKLSNVYKDNVLRVLCSNPYTLLDSIHFNFKFDTIDKIALNKLNFEKNNVIRILSYFIYEVKNEELNGNTYILEKLLLNKAYKKLSVDKDEIDIVLEAAFMKNILKRMERDSEFIIQTKEMFNIETDIVNNLQRIMSVKNKLLITNVNEKIKEIEDRNFPLYEEQKDVVINSLNNKINIINGGPGVGKTTILKFIIELLKKEHYSFSLCAPTGKAAQRMGESTNEDSSTIHRLLEYNPALKDFQKNEMDKLESDVIVIDEMSMVDNKLTSKILKAINSNSIVLIIGDINQIPSVSSGCVLKDLIQSEKIPVSKLNINRRQAENSNILKNAYLINDGKNIEYKNEKDDDFYFIKTNSDQSSLDKILQMIKTNIPNAFKMDIKKDIQILCPTHEGILGRKNLNEKLQAMINPNESVFIKRGLVTFKVGDNIIQIKNNAEKDIYNGDTGVITNITNKSITALINNKRIDYERSEFDQIELSYAITIHKSQGSEYPLVIMPISHNYIGMYDRSLLYTGITRGKKIVIFIGNESRLRSIIKNDFSRNRKSDLINKIKDNM